MHTIRQTHTQIYIYVYACRIHSISAMLSLFAKNDHAIFVQATTPSIRIEKSKRRLMKSYRNFPRDFSNYQCCKTVNQITYKES